jgi:hypothetical protein
MKELNKIDVMYIFYCDLGLDFNFLNVILTLQISQGSLIIPIVIDS